MGLLVDGHEEVMLVDYGCSTDGGYYCSEARHNGGSNMSFCDGHAEWTKNNPYGVSAGNVLGYMWPWQDPLLVG